MAVLPDRLAPGRRMRLHPASYLLPISFHVSRVFEKLGANMERISTFIVSSCETRMDALDAPPAPKRRRARRPSLSNEQLLDQALDIFLQHGFDRTSVDAITATAGMAKRTFYLRYGDKESL